MAIEIITITTKATTTTITATTRTMATTTKAMLLVVGMLNMSFTTLIAICTLKNVR